MKRFLLYCCGFVLLCTGTIHSSVYLNLIPAGYSWLEYLQFISLHPETYGVPAGAALIHFSMNRRKENTA